MGDYCEHNDNCLFNNSFCNSTTNSCACLTNYYFENEQCVKGVGSACENDDECAHIENAKCLRGNSTEKLCQCKADYVSGDDFRFCLPGEQKLEIKF